MPTYYELIVIIHREGSRADIVSGVNRCADTDEFKDGDELDRLALDGKIDTESQTVATAIGIIRWLLKNDETVKGKYALKKKK